jgi:hypothetical protein
MSFEVDASVRRAARRAYELGRLNGALVRGALAAAAAVPAFLVCGRTPAGAACLAAFGVSVAAARFRGQEWEEGAVTGALAGLAPCLMPALLRLLDPVLCDVLFDRGPWLCAIAGAAAGVILGLKSRAAAGLAFWTAGLVTFALASALGCLPAGATGFAGLAIGLVAGGVPVLAARRLLV